MEQSNYREIFKKHYQIDFSDEYDVHHIDLDHSNNDIKNLLLLPRELHQQYHSLLSRLDRIAGDPFMAGFYTQIHGTCLCGEQYNLSVIPQFITVLQECNKWYDYKMHLQGIIPNIHKITL